MAIVFRPRPRIQLATSQIGQQRPYLPGCQIRHLGFAELELHPTHYRFNLTDLRGLDIKLFEDCLSVLRLDYFTETGVAQS